MTEIEIIRRRQRWHLIEWPLIWSLSLAAFVLGLVGFAKLPGGALPASEALYRSLQLFVFEGSFEEGLNWQLEVARLLAPGVTVYTATQALIELFREQLTLLRLRFKRGHVVVCGLGRAGSKVASDTLRRGEQVVVVEADGENKSIGMIKDRGATVLTGDATEAQMLCQARVEHAKLLVVVCGNDGINVETAIHAFELKRAATRNAGPVLECHVHIIEPDLRALFKDHRVFTDTGERFRVVLFNIYDSSARLLLRRHPLDRDRIAPDDPRSVHLIVIGFGLMGESLVLQAARGSHFANGRRLRVTVIDRDPVPHQACLRRRFPKLDSVCDLAFLAREADDAGTLAEVAALCADPQALATVAICFDDDARGLALALALLPKLKAMRVPILLRMTTDGGLTALLDNEIAVSRLAGLVKPFPVIGLSSESEVLLHREMDAGAVAVHEDYRAKRRQGTHDENDPSLRPWESLDEDLRDSCRQQADHIGVKLRAIGLAATTRKDGDPVTDFTPAEVEILARMEHDRWNADRFLAGWSHAPGKKDVENKTSPWLIGWDVLPEEIREYDREAVRNIPNLVKASGGRIVRAGGG